MKIQTWVIGDACFLRRPGGHRGCYMKTDACVAFVDCPYPGCRAKAGEPCLGSRGPTASTHYKRRNDYQKLKREKGIQSKTVKYAIAVEEIS